MQWFYGKILHKLIHRGVADACVIKSTSWPKSLV